MSDQFEIPNLSVVEDAEEILKQAGEAEEAEEAGYRSVLELWQYMFNGSEADEAKPMGMNWSVHLMTTWHHLIKFSDLQAVKDNFFRIIKDVKRVLDEAVDSDPDSLLVANAEEDADRNKDLYRQIMFDWQRALLVEESEWDFEAPDATVKIVALGEVQQRLIGRDGMNRYLSAINFPFTQEDNYAMEKELQEFRESLEI